MRIILFIFFMLIFVPANSSLVDSSTAVDVHNKWRNLLNQGKLSGQPIPNPFLADVHWDDELAKSAQAHSDQCIWEHSGTGGENLYAHTGSWGSMEKGIDQWAEEYKSYDYSSNQSIDGNVVGHYTQLVWENTTKIGCGKTQCAPIKNSDGTDLWSGTMYTCQYRSSGNWVGYKPYRVAVNPTENVNYTSDNENLDFQLIDFDGIVFRAKLKIKTREPLVFKVITYEQLDNVNLNEYTNKAYAQGESIIIPKLTIDGIDNYNAEIRHIGNLEYEVINVQ